MIESPNTHVIGVSVGEEREKCNRRNNWEKMAENFLK